VLYQRVEHRCGLLPIALETPDLVITFKQGRALQRLDKDIQHLIPL